MSLKQLEEAILLTLSLTDYERREIKCKFIAFKKRAVCIPRKQLEERAYDYLTDGTLDGIAVSNYIKEELLEETK